MSTTITVRYANNTYQARVVGSRETASCTTGRKQAAEALARKLGLDPELLLNESSDGTLFEFSNDETATPIDELRQERNALREEVEQLTAKCAALKAGCPAGWAMVPTSIALEPSDIAAIMFMCGGDLDSDNPEDHYTSGILLVGSVQDDDGTITHGLHIACTESLEEGATTLAEFTAPEGDKP